MDREMEVMLTRLEECGSLLDRVRVILLLQYYVAVAYTGITFYYLHFEEQYFN